MYQKIIRKWLLAHTDWLEEDVHVMVGESNLFEFAKKNLQELKQILSAYCKKKKFILLKSGGIVNLENNEELKQLESLNCQLCLAHSKKQNDEYVLDLAHCLRVQTASEKLNEIRFKRKNSFEQVLQRFHQNVSGTLPEKYADVLRDYQKEGFYWLKKMESMGMNGILADDKDLEKHFL